MKFANRHATWYRLDNAARIYPAIVGPRLTTVFRLAVTMHQPVDRERLRMALDAVCRRYPYYQVRLRFGLFWPYLEEVSQSPAIQDERLCPCRPPRRFVDGGLLFRVLMYGRRISVEFSHILTDGSGGLAFLTALLTAYSRPDDWMELIELPAHPDPEETEDSYLRYFQKNIPPAVRRSRAFKAQGLLLPPSQQHVTTGRIPVSVLKSIVKAQGVSMTEWLAAAYLYVLQDVMMSQPRYTWRPIRLMIPVNLRNAYPSISMRNFFLTLLPEIDPRLGRHDFEECLKAVYHFMRSMNDPKFINRQLTRNVSTERNPFARYAPLIIKAPIGRMIYNRAATGEHSGVFTNLGIANLPDELMEQVAHFDFIPNPNPLTRINVGVISHGDTMSVTFGSLTDNKVLECEYFRFMIKVGVPVKIEANYQAGEG